MSPTIKYLNKKISYNDQGKGKCLVLLHGFLESQSIWNEFVENLKKEFRMLTIDLPGHGGSEIFGTKHSMELMAGAVKSVLEHLNIQECVMIGHSMGGYVTMEFASNFPEYLKGVGLFHSSVFADSAEAKQNRERTIEIIKKDRLGFIQGFIPDLFAQDNRTKYQEEINKLKREANQVSNLSVIATLKGMKDRKDHLKTISVIDVPVLFIIGKEDQRIPMDRVIEMVKLPKHSDVLILSNVGHMGYIEAKKETIEKCRYFAKKCYSGK